MITLTIDIGSSSIKAGLFHGLKLVHSVRHPLATRAQGPQVEVPAAALLRTLETAIRDVLRNRPKPDIIAFDTFSPGLVVLDRKGKIAAGAITHQDRRSIAEAHELLKTFSAQHLLDITGNCPFPGGIASTSLLWLKKNRPKVLAKDCRVGFVATLVLHHLTGEWKMDPGNAAFMGLWDIHKRRWDEKLCRVVGIDLSALPEVTFGDTILGHTLPAISRRLGLPANTPVTGGLIDTTAALLATPLNPGQLVHNAGSTDVLALCLDRPCPSPDIVTRPLGTGAFFPGRWLAVSTIAASGSAVNWARHTFFGDLSDEAFKKLLATQCRKLEKNDADISAIEFTPYLAGDRNQIDAPAAVIRGLTLGTTREAILRALLNGLIRASHAKFNRLKEICPICRDVYVAGGAAPLARAIHTHWNDKKMRFKPVKGDALMGLAKLAKAVG